jgi:hypothetical protein
MRHTLLPPAAWRSSTPARVLDIVAYSFFKS